MNEKNEYFESILQEAVKKSPVVIKVDSFNIAVEWNEVAFQLLQSKESNKSDKSNQLDESKSNNKEVLSRRNKWWEWWEGIDEIVFLFIGLAYSFIAELVVNFWSPYFAIALACCTITGILGYMGFHSYRILSGREEND